MVNMVHKRNIMGDVWPESPMMFWCGKLRIFIIARHESKLRTGSFLSYIYIRIGAVKVK